MKIYNIRSKDFILPYGVQNCAWVGSEGDRCKQYLIPIRKPEGEEVRDDEWMIKPSSTGRPVLQANAGPAPGLIIRISAFDLPGKVIGRILILSGDVRLVSNGIARFDDSIFEEALFIAQANSVFEVWYTSGRNATIFVDKDYEPLSSAFYSIPARDDKALPLFLNSAGLRKWNDADKKEEQESKE